MKQIKPRLQFEILVNFVKPVKDNLSVRSGNIMFVICKVDPPDRDNYLSGGRHFFCSFTSSSPDDAPGENGHPNVLLGLAHF